MNSVDQRNQEIVEALLSGMTSREVGELVGVHQTFASAIGRQMGLVYNKPEKGTQRGRWTRRNETQPPSSDPIDHQNDDDAINRALEQAANAVQNAISRITTLEQENERLSTANVALRRESEVLQQDARSWREYKHQRDLHRKNMNLTALQEGTAKLNGMIVNGKATA